MFFARIHTYLTEEIFMIFLTFTTCLILHILFILRYKHIIFDLDGTLIDSEAGIKNSLRYALEKMQIPFDLEKRYKEFIGPPLHDGFMNVLGLSEIEAEKGVAIFREYYSSRGVYESCLYPGIYQLLDDLYDQKHNLYLATSKLEKYACSILKHLEIDGFFTAISGAAYRGSGADKTLLIERILTNIPKNDRELTIMVGDTCYDIEAARHIGIKAIGVLYGFGSNQELSGCGAVCIVKNVEELKQQLLITR